MKTKKAQPQNKRDVVERFLSILWRKEVEDLNIHSTGNKIEKFTLINKDRSRIKVFEPFEDVSNPSPSINAMMISYGCVYKRSSKPVMKGSKVETVEEARREYKKLLEEGWKKTSIFNSYF